jgi:hypothetical protein
MMVVETLLLHGLGVSVGGFGTSENFVGSFLCVGAACS